MKLSSFVYQSFIRVYHIIPFQKTVCRLIKLSGIDNNKFYKDLKFDGEFEVKTDDASFKLLSNKSSSIENEIFWKGLGKSWEDDTIWVWMELCKNAETVIDIGANTGVYSLIVKALNPKAKVYAFEPVQRTFSWLKKNIELNGFDVKPEMIALSNINGVQVFYDSPHEMQTSASLSPDKLKNFSGYKGEIVEYNVTTTTLDNFITQRNIQKVDLIKIDVELHEPEVLEGFIQYMHVFKPSIVVEVLTPEVAEKLNPLVEQSGYKIYHLAGKNKLVEKEKIEALYPYWNYLLCQNDTAQKLQKYIY